MNISSITFNYDSDNNISYIISVGGATNEINFFNGQVILDGDELDLSFILPLVQEKLANSFTKEEKENLPLELTEK